MRTRTVLEIAVVWVLIAAFLVGYIGTATMHVTATSATTPTLAGSPTHYGHTMIGVGSGPLSTSADVALSCPLTVADNCLGSYNWDGYVVYNSSYTVTHVIGSWVVPTIVGATSTTCPDAQRTWDSNSVWVGIDGAFTPTVEQTGTSSDCFYGEPSYYAWYEFYPSGSVVSSNAVYPGDHITAWVTYEGLSAGVPTFKTVLEDTTQGWNFVSPITPVPDAALASAEWIDESPYYDGFLGLTHVQPVDFFGASATIGGVSKSLGDWGKFNIYWVVSVDYNFPYDETIFFVKAEPLALASNGAGFKVDWVSSGP